MTWIDALSRQLSGRARGPAPWLIAICQPRLSGRGVLSTRRAFLQSSAAVRRRRFAGSAARRAGMGRRAQALSDRDARCSPRSERMLAFPVSLTPGLKKTELNQVSRYKEFGYGEWSFGSGLPIVQRTDLMPAGYQKPASAAKTRLLEFFSILRRPHHRQGSAQPADRVPAERAGGGQQHLDLFAGDAVFDPGARRRRADRQRSAPARPVRLRHRARRRLQQHLVQRAALVHRRDRRQADRAELGRASRRRQHRLPDAVPGRRPRQDDLPGTRCSATTIIS